jgi:hypothetical protein
MNTPCPKKHKLTFGDIKKLIRRGWIDLRYHRNAALNEDKLEILGFREYNKSDN